MKIHLKNFEIFSPDPNCASENGSLLIDDGIIEEVITEFPRKEKISAEKTIEGRGRLLLPGFVNSHTHLGMTLFRGYADDIPLSEWLRDWIWPAEEKLTPEEVYWSSMLGIIEAIRSGTTTVCDMYFHMDEAAKAIEDSGIRGLISSGIIAEELSSSGEEEIKSAINIVDRWDGEGNGRISTSLSPHAPYTCGDAVLEEISRLASKKEVPIHTHLSETQEEVEESYEEAGISPVRRLEKLGVFENPVLAAHCVHLEDEDIEILGETGVVVAHNPTSNMKLASGMAPISNLRQRGVKVTLGTDGPGSNNDLDMFEEMRLASLLGKIQTNDPTSLKAADVWKMATAWNIDRLGFSQLGRIEKGAKADLIGLERNQAHWIPEYSTLSNLVYAGKSANVELLMVDGNLIMEEGKIKTIEESKVIEQVEKISKKYKQIRKTSFKSNFQKSGPGNY